MFNYQIEKFLEIRRKKKANQIGIQVVVYYYFQFLLLINYLISNWFWSNEIFYLFCLGRIFKYLSKKIILRRKK